MKKFKVFKWNMLVNYVDKEGNYMRTELITNDSVDMIEKIFNSIPEKERPTGTENYKLMRKFLKATKPARKTLTQLKEAQKEEETVKRKEWNEYKQKRVDDNNPILTEELMDFERTLRVETDMILDEKIYDFIKEKGMDKFLPIANAFNELTAEALDEFIDAIEHFPPS